MFLTARWAVVGFEDHANSFTSEGHVDAERRKQTRDKPTAKVTPLARGAPGTQGWRALQTAPQYAVDVGVVFLSSL